MSPAPQLVSLEASLEILSGKEKGAIFDIISEEISIGRNADNDIVLANDPKVSRNHALIRINVDQPFIKDISGRNFILVDGKKKKDSPLVSGTVITIGDTKMKFRLTPVQPVSNLPSAIPGSMPPANLDSSQMPVPHGGGAPSLSSAGPANWDNPIPSNPSPPKKSGKMMFYVILIVVIVLTILLSTEPEDNGIEDDGLTPRTTEEILRDNEKSREREELIKKARQASGKNTKQFDEAQASYLRCFRDYQQGQYSRAIQHCQAALSIFPKHELAERYLGLNKRKRDEKIQFLLRQGRVQLDRGQYKICKSTLQTVMLEIGDRSNKTFKEALQMYKECVTLDKGRY